MDGDASRRSSMVGGNAAKFDPHLSMDLGSIWTGEGDNCISDDCNDFSHTPSPDLDGDDITDGGDLGVLLAAWS